MTFDKRNEQWDGKAVRYFRQNQTRSSSPRFWKCWVEGAKIFAEWGQVGGAVQQVNETATGVNKGKKNAIGPEAYALYLAQEKCRKKHWEGYREYADDGTLLDKEATKINFNNPPKNLAFWKPDNSPGPGILKKAEAKTVWYARKMNGLMYCAWSNDAGEVFLTSRRMLRQQDDEEGTEFTWNDRFPLIITALSKIMPPKSCVLGELVAFDKDNKDSLALIGGYAKSLTPKALDEQSKNSWAYYYIWDVAFWDGQDLVTEAPIEARYQLIHEVMKDPILIPVQIIAPGQHEGFETPDQMRELAKQWGWEGFVMVDPKGIFGDRAYNFKGKPDRPGKFAAKIKPEYEDDLIVVWNPEGGYGEYSTKGRYGKKGVKSVCLYQLNTKGEMVYIANCASGMTEEMKSSMKPKVEPQGVWKIIYTDRRYISDGDDTNAVDFPRFDSVREDKSISECVNPRL